MSTSIFIKTCKKDLEWLRYCLESIRKYAIGFDEVVIVADRSCIGSIGPVLTGPEKVIYVPDWINGYIQQQYVKLHADGYCSSENILFVDSDVVFFDYFSENSFMVGRKPILLKTRYGNLEGAEAWRAITEQAMGFPVEWEYMRRFPLLYRKDTITAFRNAFYGVVESLKRMPDHAFSEFNALGAFVEKYQPQDYFISDTADWMPHTVAKQFWSWGAMSHEIQQEMRGFIDGSNAVQNELHKLQSRDNIGYVLNAMGLNGFGAEVGVAFGENAEQILSKSRLEALLLIDPWDYVNGEDPKGHGDMIKDWVGCYRQCSDRLRKFGERTQFLRTTSEGACNYVFDESLDFVYIDANHMSPMVDRDIEIWFPKVKPGGIFGGHDYHNYKNEVFQCDVKRAVDKFFAGSKYMIHVVPGEVPSWYVIK